MASKPFARERLRVENLRPSESPYIPGQRVALYSWGGELIEQVTIKEVCTNVDQCIVVRASGKEELVSEKRLRA